MDTPVSAKNQAQQTGLGLKLDSQVLEISSAFESIANNSPDNIMLLDRSGCIQYINHTVPDLTIAQVIGVPVTSFVPEEYRAAIEACLKRVAKTRKPDRYETAYVNDKNQTSYWESRVGPVINAGEVVGFAVTSSNVTERKAAAMQLDRFFSLSVDILCVAGLDGYFQRVNSAFEHTLGYSEAELLSRRYHHFVHPDDIQDTEAIIRQLSAGKPVIDFENRYQHKDGSYRVLSWRAMFDTRAEIVYAVARDITDKKLLEAELQQSQKMQAVGQLAGGIAHDFNNLLMAISANIEFAQNSSNKDDITEFLKEIGRATGRATELTSQLLAFGRRQPLNRQSLDVNELVHDVLKLLRRLLPENIQIVLSILPKLKSIVGDRSQLEQVIINLMLNARDALEDGGQIEISTDHKKFTKRFCEKNSWARQGEYVRLSVKDNGCGIGDKVKEHIFEPFFSTKEQGKGTGLGLAMVYGTVEAHAGLLHLESQLGAGATFHLYFPIEELVAPSEKPESTKHSYEGYETILVAEDEPSVREVVVEILASAGYRVITACDGCDAVEEYKKYQREIDMLLFDVIMPGMNGPDAAAAIREQTPNLPILYTSGYAEASILDSVSRRGDTVLAKPYQAKQLLKSIRQVLDKE